jgi:uncharacterized protein
MRGTPPPINESSAQSPSEASRSRFAPDKPNPVRVPVMHQSWCRISFLHWPCDPPLLQSRLPAGLVLDTFAGAGWVSLTPFHLTDLRPPLLPAVPWLSHFPEMNLRTYVRGPAGSGIWFFSLDAASLGAVLGGRFAYGLPYHWATMRICDTGSRVYYASRRASASAAITVDVGEAMTQPDDLVVFLTERYLLYTKFLGCLAVAPVEHAPWPLRHATLASLEETVRRASRLPGEGTPLLVHYSEGVEVRIGALRPATFPKPSRVRQPLFRGLQV